MSDTQRKILYNRLYKILDFITDGVYVFLFVLAYLTCCTVVMFIHTPTFVFMICLLMYMLLVYIVIMAVCSILRYIFLWKLANKLFYGDFKTYLEYCSKLKDYIYYSINKHTEQSKCIYTPLYEKVIKLTGRPVWCIKGKFK